MAAKGSRKNPYTLVEYNQIGGNWNGGWIKESPDYIIYRNQNLTETYTGFCEKSNPVPGSLYTEMMQNGIWLGGWVLLGSSTKEYIDSNGTGYSSTLGSQSNPCTMEIYNEMLSNGIWEGGWVQESNGQTHYVQVFYLTLNSGSGCGSGAGSGSCPFGSGSGSGDSSSEGFPIRAGNCIAGKVVDKVTGVPIGELRLSWTQGNTRGGDNLSEVSVSIKLSDYTYCVLQNNSYTFWIAPYVVAIHGTFLIQHNHDQHDFSIDGRYSIPYEHYLI